MEAKFIPNDKKCQIEIPVTENYSIMLEINDIFHRSQPDMNLSKDIFIREFNNLLNESYVGSLNLKSLENVKDEQIRTKHFKELSNDQKAINKISTDLQTKLNKKMTTIFYPVVEIKKFKIVKASNQIAPSVSCGPWAQLWLRGMLV